MSRQILSGQPIFHTIKATIMSRQLVYQNNRYFIFHNNYHFETSILQNSISKISTTQHPINNSRQPRPLEKGIDLPEKGWTLKIVMKPSHKQTRKGKNYLSKIWYKSKKLKHHPSYPKWLVSNFSFKKIINKHSTDLVWTSLQACF